MSITNLEDSGRQEAGKCPREQGTPEEQGNSKSELASGVEQGQIEDDTGKEAGLKCAGDLMIQSSTWTSMECQTAPS